MAKNYWKGCNETSHTIRDKEGDTMILEEIAKSWSECFEELLNITNDTL